MHKKTYVIQRKDFFNLGYDVVGPVLLGYTQWLIQQMKKNDISKVYFLSREGYLFKKAFDLLSDGSFITDYLEVSRKSIRVASMNVEGFSASELVDDIINSKRISIGAFLDSIGVDVEECASLIRDRGINPDIMLTKEELKNGRATEICDKLSDVIKEEIPKQSHFFYEYLNQKEVKGRFAIADIGYAGTMQKYLIQYLDKNHISSDIYGLYLCVTKDYLRNADIVEKDKIKGFWFDFNEDRYKKDYRSLYVGLLECLFMETRGSVKNYYKDDNGKVKSNRYSSEFNYPVKGNTSEKRLKMIQKGALSFLIRNKDNEVIGISFDNLVRLGNTPKKLEIKMFESFCFFNEGEYTPLINSKGIGKYAFDVQGMMKDFYLSKWKTAFLRKTLLLDIDYSIICNMFLRN